MNESAHREEVLLDSSARPQKWKADAWRPQESGSKEWPPSKWEASKWESSKWESQKWEPKWKWEKTQDGENSSAKRDEPNPVPKFFWLTIDKKASALINDGFGAEAPAVLSDTTNRSLFGKAHPILADVVGVTSVSVDLFDDPDWSDFPEVAAAYKHAFGEKEGLCIATCAARGKWAVGAGSKWRFRENAAKLALAIALVEDSDDTHELFGTWPDFRALCHTSKRPTRESKRQKKWHENIKNEPVREKVPRYNPLTDVDEQGSDSPASIESWRNVPFWIELPDPIPFIPEDLSARVLGVGSKGIGWSELYSCADDALVYLSGWAHEDIEYHDDVMWENFPAVGAVLKDILNVEECFVAAVCAPLGVWGLGIGMKVKHRYSAAKVALATTLAIQAKETGSPPDLSEFPALATFVEMVPTI